MLCTWPGVVPDGVGPGARVRVHGRFRLPRAPTNPGEPDGRLRLAVAGAALIADLRTVENLELIRSAPPGLRSWLERARRAGSRTLAEALPEPTAALATALLLGIRSGIPEADVAIFERTGTLHLLAISGMHLLLLAGIVHRLLRIAGAGTRTAAALTLLLVLLYVPLAGGAPPVRRAAAMAGAYALALLRGRPADGASALGGAALLLALADPLEVNRIGFRLSFAATTGIHLLAGRWRDRWSARSRMLGRFPVVRRERRLGLALARYATGALPVALAAWLATTGFVAHAFGVVHPHAPWVNLLVAPVLSLLLPAIALLALGLHPLAFAVVALSDLMRWILSLAAEIPGSVVAVPPLGWVGVASWCLGCGLLRGRPKWGALVLASTAVVCLRPAAPGALELRLFDVGHGQAVLVRLSNGRAALIDAGSRGRPQLGRRVLLPALRAVGVRRLDAVLCTHADADHWNAIPPVLARLPVDRLLIGERPPPRLLEAARRFGVPVQRVRAGDVVISDEAADAALRVLAVGLGDAWSSKNDGSVALRLDVGDLSVMLPADRGKSGLAGLLADGLAGPCILLVAPHHGGRVDGAAEFGRAIRPGILLISTGPRFTDPETLSAYGARILHSTAELGCLTVSIPDPTQAGLPHVSGFLEQHGGRRRTRRR